MAPTNKMMLVTRILNRIASIKTVIVYKITPIIPLHTTFTTNLQILPINNTNINLLKSLREEKLIKTFSKFLSTGEIGFMVLSDGKCVAHGWLIENPEQHHKIVCDYFQLPSNSAFIHYCYVDATMRGKGIYKFLLNKISLYYFSSSPSNKNLLIDTNIHNIPAQRAISAIGGQYQYKLKIFRILGSNIIIKKIH